jgi:ferritin
MEEFMSIRQKAKPTFEAVQLTSNIVKPNTLPKEIEAKLNARIGDEYTAHYFYRNAANWCKNVNYKNAAAFFEAEAMSELEHAKGLQDYLTQWNLMPAIPAAPTSKTFTSLAQIISEGYSMEYDLFEKYSIDQEDTLTEHPATFNFLQGYVNIQNDAVGEYSDLLNALELINLDSKLDVLFFETEYFG